MSIKKFPKHDKKSQANQNNFDMLEFEKQYENEIVCGIDEAGRGPLFGPVVAAAVILNKDVDFSGLNDSKKLSEKQRNFFYEKIISTCEYAIGIADNTVIDKINILEATKIAMINSVEALRTKPAVLLVDAVKLSYKESKVIPIIKGDQKSYSIAAASVIAKVTRDEMMKQYQEEYPNFSLAKHKGYPTKLHYEEINEHGITKLHRKSFLKKYENKY